MAVEIGKEFSPQMSGLLKSSLSGKDMTQIAAKFNESFYVVKSLVYGERAITKKTYELAKNIVTEAVGVNKIAITRRRTLNDEIKKISQVIEQAA